MFTFVFACIYSMSYTQCCLIVQSGLLFRFSLTFIYIQYNIDIFLYFQASKMLLSE